MAKLTRLVNSAADPPVVDDLDIETAGPHGPTLLQDLWLIEHLAHLDREVTPERRIHAKGFSGLTVTHDIRGYTKAKTFSQIGNKTGIFIGSGRDRGSSSRAICSAQ
jgi:catalase